MGLIMGQRIKEFENGAYLEYDSGSFDSWCVYLVNANGVRKAPRDVEYFASLKNYAQKYGTNKIYADYVRIYNLTGNRIDNRVLQEISDISNEYPEDAIDINIIYSILYMAMIAEEKKEKTRLGKRIKRIGIHKLLIENCSVYTSANFMRGMGWREIDALCRERGF